MISDAKFIELVNGWPKWPSLPMKHKDGRCGFLVDAQPIESQIDPKHVSLRTVYLMNPWEFFTKPAKKLSEVPTQVFETIEAMLNDGWEID